MASYYNEIDPQKAAWLRELIVRGTISPGDVDERSIADVRPDELAGYTQCHFFAGIGIWSYALRLAGWSDDREVWTGSCPCQPFSAAGKGEAFNDERHLWPEFFRLIEARRPIVCFGEQVASIDGLAWLDLVQSDLDDAGYTCGAVDLCAAGVGAPHRRQRLYWVADTEHAERRTKQQEHGNAHGRNGSGRRGDVGGMADDSRDGCGEERSLNGRIGPGFDASGHVNGMGNASGAGLEKRRCESGDAGQECASTERTGEVGRLGNAESIGRRRRENLSDTGGGNVHLDKQVRLAGWQTPHGPREHDSEVSESTYLGREVQLGAWPTPMAQTPAQDGYNEAGNTDSGRKTVEMCQWPVDPSTAFGETADWVLTRPQRVGDRPGLRPVERGAFPLAHGTSARVGRLRGYGDGIVAQAAQAFIEAYMKL